MNPEPSAEDNLDYMEDHPLPLRAWEQAALKEVVTIVQGLCSCGYPQPGDIIFALRDVAACLEEQYVGTQGRAMAQEILSALTGHDYTVPRHKLTALPPALPSSSPHPKEPIAWMDGKPVYPDDFEAMEDEHEQEQEEE